MAGTINFPRRHRQDQLDYREMCRALVAETSLAGKHTPTEIERAVETVVAIAEQYWFKEPLVIQWSEGVQFTPEQLGEITQALKRLHDTIFRRAATERLVHELNF